MRYPSELRARAPFEKPVRSFFDNGFNSDAQVVATLTFGKQVFPARAALCWEGPIGSRANGPSDRRRRYSESRQRTRRVNARRDGGRTDGAEPRDLPRELLRRIATQGSHRQIGAVWQWGQTERHGRPSVGPWTPHIPMCGNMCEWRRTWHSTTNSSKKP